MVGGLELLAPVYGWFTEGFDTKDLKNAKALLARRTQRLNNSYGDVKLLIGVDILERLDTGTTSAAGRTDPQLEALGSIDRTKDR